MKATVHEVFACHLMLNRLGFPTKDMFIGIVGTQVTVHLGNPGKIAFLIGELPERDRSAFLADWRDLCEASNSKTGTMTPEEKDKIYRESAILQGSTAMIAALMGAGLWNGTPIWEAT